MEESLSRRERKKLETRSALMEAALSLFREKGYDQTTVEEITEQADVAKATFFNYFPSKQALVGELVAWRTEQLHETLQVEQGATDSPMAQFKGLFHRFHGEILKDWPLFQQGMAAQLGPPRPPCKRGPRRLTGILADLIRSAQACGEVRADVEPEWVGHLILMAYLSRFGASLHEQGAVPPADESERIVDLFMDGLAGPTWRRL
jgi:AcrR family transcriptional regulator